MENNIKYSNKKDSFSIKAVFSNDNRKIDEVIKESFKKYLKYIDYK